MKKSRIPPYLGIVLSTFLSADRSQFSLKISCSAHARQGGHIDINKAVSLGDMQGSVVLQESHRLRMIAFRTLLGDEKNNYAAARTILKDYGIKNPSPDEVRFFVNQTTFALRSHDTSKEVLEVVHGLTQIEGINVRDLPPAQRDQAIKKIKLTNVYDAPIEHNAVKYSYQFDSHGRRVAGNTLKKNMRMFEATKDFVHAVDLLERYWAPTEKNGGVSKEFGKKMQTTTEFIDDKILKPYLDSASKNSPTKKLPPNIQEWIQVRRVASYYEKGGAFELTKEHYRTLMDELLEDQHIARRTTDPKMALKAKSFNELAHETAKKRGFTLGVPKSLEGIYPKEGLSPQNRSHFLAQLKKAEDQLKLEPIPVRPRLTQTSRPWKKGSQNPKGLIHLENASVPPGVAQKEALSIAKNLGKRTGDIAVKAGKSGAAMARSILLPIGLTTEIGLSYLLGEDLVGKIFGDAYFAGEAQAGDLGSPLSHEQQKIFFGLDLDKQIHQIKVNAGKEQSSRLNKSVVPSKRGGRQISMIQWLRQEFVDLDLKTQSHLLCMDSTLADDLGFECPKEIHCLSGNQIGFTVSSALPFGQDRKGPAKMYSSGDTTPIQSQQGPLKPVLSYYQLHYESTAMTNEPLLTMLDRVILPLKPESIKISKSQSEKYGLEKNSTKQGTPLRAELRQASDESQEFQRNPQLKWFRGNHKKIHKMCQGRTRDIPLPLGLHPESIPESVLQATGLGTFLVLLKEKKGFTTPSTPSQQETNVFMAEDSESIR